MRKQIFTAVFAAALGAAGCNSGSPGGATNAGDRSSNPLSPDEQKFTLSVPTLSTHLKQSEAKVVAIGVKRGKNFDKDVSLKFDNLPKGVTADPSAPTIKHGEEETKVTFKAADDAAIGDFTVKVTGHPGAGGDATNDIKLTVGKK